MSIFPDSKEFNAKFFGNIGFDDAGPSKSSQRSNKSSASHESGGSYQESNTDAGDMKRKIFGSLTSESDCTLETPSPRPDKKKIKSSPSIDEYLMVQKEKKGMDNVTVRRGKDRSHNDKESGDLDHLLKDSGSEEEDMFAGSGDDIDISPNKKIKSTPAPAPMESRDEIKKSRVGPLDSFVVRRSSGASITSIQAEAADILADSDDDERFRREVTPSPDIFKTSQSQEKIKSTPNKSKASSPSHITKKALGSPVSDSDSLGSFASKSPSPKVYRHISSSQESNSSSKRKGQSSQSSSVFGIKKTKSSGCSKEVKKENSFSNNPRNDKADKSSINSGGTEEKSSSYNSGTREESSSSVSGENSSRCPITGLRKKVKSSQNKKLFNWFGSDNEEKERTSSQNKDKEPLIKSKRTRDKDKDIKEASVESKKTNEKAKDMKSKSSKIEKDHIRLKDKNFDFDENYKKEKTDALDARRNEKNKKKSERSSKTRNTLSESSDEEKKENVKEKKENVKYYKIPKLEKKNSYKAASATDEKTARDKSSRNCPSFFGSGGSKKYEPGPSTSGTTFKFFKEEDIPKKEIAYKMVKDKNGELKKIRVDPSTVKHYKTDMVLGPAGQAALDYAYGVNDPKKPFKYTPPSSLSSSESDTEEESTQEKNKKSSKSNNKSSKKSSKKKKQKNILSYMTVRPDMDEINELLAMKIPRPDEDDGIDVAAMIKRNTDAREANEKYARESKEARRKQKEAIEKYEDENAALRDRLEAELTHEKIEEYFKEFKPICEEIWAGEAEWCWRHEQFYKDTNSRQGLLYKQILDPFTSDQVETGNSHISKIYMRDKTEWFANNHYCSNVLLPEFLTYMYMNMFSLDREEAATRMKNTPLKPEDDHLGVYIREPDSP